jgi:L-aspartate oxidase
MRDQGVDHLWLDLRPVGKDRLERQFPTILRRCQTLGLRPTEEPIPVAPAAHYWMGGISTDLNAATSLEGLYAVGEVACTGVHGANRLASNSLMECLVFARRLARIDLQPQPTVIARRFCRRVDPALSVQGDPEAEVMALRRLCWDVAGVERTGPRLLRALRRVRCRRAEWENEPLMRLVHGLEPGEEAEIGPGSAQPLLVVQDLRQRLVLAELLIEAALFRCESRGGHHRSDAPAPQPFWQRHTAQQRGGSIRTLPLGGVRDRP